MDFNNPKSGMLHNSLTTSASPILLRLVKSTIPEDNLEIGWADLVEADFPGYAPISMDSLDEGDVNTPDLGEVISDQLYFTAGVIVTPQAIYATAVTRANANGGHDLLALNPLPEIVVVDTEKQSIPFQVRWMAAEGPA